MGLFSQSKTKPVAQPIRIERVTIPVAKGRLGPPGKAHSDGGHSNSLKRKSPSTMTSMLGPRSLPKATAYGRGKSASTDISSSANELRRGTKRKAMSLTPFGGDSDAEDSDDDPFIKKPKLVDNSRDPDRQLPHKKAFGEEVWGTGIIHTRDLASIKNGCTPFFSGAKEGELTVEVQYPSRTKQERYELCYGNDQIEAVNDIIEIVRLVASFYLNPDEAKPFLDPDTGFQRRLERFSSKRFRSLADFKANLHSYNKLLAILVAKGSVAKNLSCNHALPKELVQFILKQVYDRTVSPKAELLNRYQPGSDNVYGELQYDFIHEVLVNKTKMTSSQIFVDIGSGVGNVVLQAALEIGCRSYGCEMVDSSCDFAEKQEREFKARCHLWGLRPGRLLLERGDIRQNQKIHETLKEADVILVNNKAFTAALNRNLTELFLDLKSGCKVVSLVSFVKGNDKNMVNDVASNIFSAVEELSYPRDWVSWSAEGGTYYISTKK